MLEESCCSLPGFCERRNKEVMVLMVLLLLQRQQSLNVLLDLDIWNRSRGTASL